MAGAVRHGQARERDGLVERPRPVVDAGQEVEMQFGARVLQSSRSPAGRCEPGVAATGPAGDACARDGGPTTQYEGTGVVTAPLGLERVNARSQPG
jgi:hypothetical protein